MKKISIIIAIIFCIYNISNAQTTIPREVADEFGKLLVYHNNRICPMQTLARDYTIKLTGKTTYKNLTAEQVLFSTFFFYDEWRNKAIIKIKGKDVRHTLGINDKYASLNDFMSQHGYKLTGSRGKDYSAADEKYNLMMMNITGSLMRIFPYKTYENTDSLTSLHWFAINDQLPHNIPEEQWLFIRKSMNLIAEYLAHQQYNEAIDIIRKIRIYQNHQLDSLVPSKYKISAERIYNHFNYNRIFAIFLMTIGIVLYVINIVKKHTPHWAWLISAITIIYLAISLILRGYISGHFPLANGFETMQFLSLIAAIIPFILKLSNKNSETLLAHSILISGIALMVATMSELNPRITLLMPVLQSPLLSIHVMVIMISYALFALMTLTSIANIIKNSSDNSALKMLPLALFLLTAGIFIGAIWANISWGRYWGWDPKEVWALITMLIYSLPLHRASLTIFQNKRFVNWYFIFAFLSVIITYFGVNFILGGLHSYA